MAIVEYARIPDTEHEKTRKMITDRLANGKQYWKPLHDRQDYWAMMYYLMDAVQQMKPPNHRRFISNEPRTAVDLALSILTRNDAYWRIALFEETGQNSDTRRLIGKVERALQGMIYDIDEMFSMRLKPRFWKQAAFSALVRGFIWAKVHITTDALEYRDTPILADFYDPRLVYPHTDAFGLNYVIIETQTTLGDLVNMYPNEFAHRESDSNYNPNGPASVIEYWSNDRGGRKGICAVMATETPVEQSGVYNPFSPAGAPVEGCFVIPPYEHGYKPDALPIVGVPVNGSNLTVRPQLGGLLHERLSDRAAALDSITPLNWWGDGGQVAEIGRSILANVEEHIPQYNELIATIMQHLAMSTYGTYVFTSPTGEQPRFNPGIEQKIALTPEEKLERIQVGPINADAFKLVELLGDEKQNGMLANILRANTPFQGTGVLFQQMANAALNALEPFQDGMEEFGQRVGTSILAQLQAAKGIIKPFELMTRSSAGASKRQSYWVVDFDPKTDLGQQKRMRPRPIFNPALPDDMAQRINAARLALDPKRPILSLTTVLEHILQVEDPTDEIDRIWEDIANTDPVLVFEQISQALERMGETEMAQRIAEKQFRTAFIEELAFRQSSGGAIPQPGIPNNGEMADPSNMPPAAGANEFATQTAEDAGMGGGGAASAGQPGLPNGEQTSV